MENKKEERNKKRAAMTETVIDLITEKLFPFMGIYGLVKQRKELGLFNFLDPNDWETMFKSTARALVKTNIKPNPLGDRFFLVFNWTSLRIPHEQNFEQKNPELQMAITNLAGSLNAKGYHIGISVESEFIIWMEEPFPTIDETLATIKTIWRQHDNASTLWGIPYKMDSTIGQAPRDLFESDNTDGWVNLTNTIWRGNRSKNVSKRVKTFLDNLGDLIPKHPGEFCEL